MRFATYHYSCTSHVLMMTRHPSISHPSLFYILLIYWDWVIVCCSASLFSLRISYDIIRRHHVLLVDIILHNVPACSSHDRGSDNTHNVIPNLACHSQQRFGVSVWGSCGQVEMSLISMSCTKRVLFGAEPLNLCGFLCCFYMILPTLPRVTSNNIFSTDCNISFFGLLMNLVLLLPSLQSP